MDGILWPACGSGVSLGFAFIGGGVAAGDGATTGVLAGRSGCLPAVTASSDRFVLASPAGEAALSLSPSPGPVLLMKCPASDHMQRALAPVPPQQGGQQTRSDSICASFYPSKPGDTKMIGTVRKLAAQKSLHQH